jgi:hypothetical protein
MSKHLFMFLFRYIMAIAIACVVSFASELLLGVMLSFMIPDSCPQFVGDIILFALDVFVGFVGVLSGTYCLERRSRRYGSILLLGMGLGFYTWFWLMLCYSIPPFHYRGLPAFWPLMVGGLAAILLFWLRKPPNTALEPTPTAP